MIVVISNKIDKDINLLANTKLNENTSKNAIAYLVVENAKLIKENEQLKKEKDDVVNLLKIKIARFHNEENYYLTTEDFEDLLRMLGEKDEQDLQR